MQLVRQDLQAPFVVSPQWLEVFISNQVSPATQKAYRYDLGKWFEWLGGLDVLPTVEKALSFRKHLEENYGSRTAARIFNTCRVFYRFLGGWNPFQALKSPRTLKNRTPMVPDDLLVARMLDLVDNPRDKLVLTLLLNGLRRAEVAELRSDSIQWSPNYGCDIIRVIGKGMKERLVPANVETSLAARSYSGGEFWLFKGDEDGHISRRAVEYVVEKWSTAAGQKISPHKLRHHYGTRLARSDVGLTQLADLMGHESVNTTQIYVRMDLGDLVKAAAKDPMNIKLEVIK